VTGSSSGIGRAIALSFAREGAHVVCADIRESSVHETENASSGHNTADLVEGLFIETDVSVSEDMQNLIEKTVEEYGRVDMCVVRQGRTHSDLAS